MYTTMEMTGFRRNISERIYQDEALLDEPFNLVALPELDFKKRGAYGELAIQILVKY